MTINFFNVSVLPEFFSGNRSNINFGITQHQFLFIHNNVLISEKKINKSFNY